MDIVEKQWGEILHDAKELGSATTTLFYIHLVIHCPPGTWVTINSSEIGRLLNITNPYNHLKRIIDAGLGERINNGHHGTKFRLLKNYAPF